MNVPMELPELHVTGSVARTQGSPAHNELLRDPLGVCCMGSKDEDADVKGGERGEGGEEGCGEGCGDGARVSGNERYSAKPALDVYLAEPVLDACLAEPVLHGYLAEPVLGACLADPVLLMCRLCLDECAAQHMYALQHCACTFCTECVKEYVRVEITEGNVMSITCPDGNCVRSGVIDASEIKVLVDEKVFEKFERLRFEREVDVDPGRTFCPRPGCEAVCEVIAPLVTLPSATPVSVVRFPPSVSIAVPLPPMPTSVRCHKCGALFCSVCKYDWHDSRTCDESMQANSREADGIPFSSAEDANIKRCPVCRVPIERNDGCAQMMCKQCKHVFCWYCLTSLDDDFLLRHYDKGQCKNRLGHSRASVIWHRTQVVAIFAGFGVLLLVASPFLLLAAPCILCCKYRSCRLSEEEEATTEGAIPPSSTVIT